MDPNKVSKICNVAIPLTDSVFPDGKYCTCDFWSRLHEIAFISSKFKFSACTTLVGTKIVEHAVKIWGKIISKTASKNELTEL
jgi:hypothetical protein